jgi:hypothetical protein
MAGGGLRGGAIPRTGRAGGRAGAGGGGLENAA